MNIMDITKFLKINGSLVGGRFEERWLSIPRRPAPDTRKLLFGVLSASGRDTEFESRFVPRN